MPRGHYFSFSLIYIHAPKQCLTSLHSLIEVWHGMACQWEMFYIHVEVCVYYRGVWHGVPMGDVGQHTLP